MGLANLRKAAILDQSTQENSPEMERLVSLCYNKPLYYSWHVPKHEQKYHKTNGQCCIWHLLGPELKDGYDMPMLPYQNVLYRALRENKRIWIKKARGIGVTYNIFSIPYRIPLPYPVTTRR